MEWYSFRKNIICKLVAGVVVKKWGTDFVGKIIRATHGLWMERNNILHLRIANGIKSLCIISMQTAVERQLDLGHENLDEEDHYLLENDVETIMKEPVEMIRGWLCEILIARGDFASARLESLRDRNDISHIVPILTDREMEKIFRLAQCPVATTIMIYVYKITLSEEHSSLPFDDFHQRQKFS